MVKTMAHLHCSSSRILMNEGGSGFLCFFLEENYVLMKLLN